MESALSLGSNQGDRLDWLAHARHALAGTPGVRILACSPVYETEPVEVPEAFTHQQYLNQVVIVETMLDARSLSDIVHAIEKRLGRTRGPTPNQPRIIDIDIITFGGLRSDTPDLTLPHPRAHTRRFVLQPLADLRPDMILPGKSLTIADLLRTLPPEPCVTRLM